MPRPTSDCRATERNHPWPMVRLGDVCEITAGNSAPQNKDLFLDGTHPFIRTSDVGEIHFGIIVKSRDKLNDAGIAGLRLFPKGSVLFPKSGASTYLNHRVLLGVNAYVVSHLAVIMPSEQVYPQYLLYALAVVDAKTLMQDSSYPALRTAEIGAAKFPLPSLAEQKEIVARLERELAAVEKMKKGFEALSETAKAEFKAELKEVFEGLRCSGVEMRRLEDVCELKAGGDKPTVFSKCVIDTMRIPVVSNGIQNDGICGYTNVATEHAGCVTVSARGTIGWSCVRDYSFVPIVRLIVVRPKDKVDVGYLLRMLQQLSFNQSGSSIPQLTVPMLKGVEIPLPSLPVQRQIVDRLSAAKARAEKMEAKAREGVAVCETMRKAILKEAFE